MGEFWLVMAVWAADQYILMNDRVVGSHPKYEEQCNAWCLEGDGVVDSILRGTIIKSIALSETECNIVFITNDDNEYRMLMCKFNEKLSPMENDEPRKNAFEEGVLSDYLLVTYKDTVLQV